jgi:hypothetical protein
MKLFPILLTLCVTVSCGKKDTIEVQVPHNLLAEKSLMASPDHSHQFDLPRVGFHRSVNINYHFEHMYENMTINPPVPNPAPGAKPFFISMSTATKMYINYYPYHDIKKVQYIDYKSSIDFIDLKSIPLHEILNNPKIRTIKNPYREFSLGDKHADFPEQEMSGKVFIVESEAADLPYVSKMTIMFWFQCVGDEIGKSKSYYNCDSQKFNFHYKLLSYNLINTDA